MILEKLCPLCNNKLIEPSLEDKNNSKILICQTPSDLTSDNFRYALKYHFYYVNGTRNMFIIAQIDDKIFHIFKDHFNMIYDSELLKITDIFTINIDNTKSIKENLFNYIEKLKMIRIFT